MDLWEDLFDAAALALDTYAGEFAARLRAGDISTDCMADIGALGITADAWADALDDVSIQMGIGSTDPYYEALPVGSSDRATAQQRNLPIGASFRRSNGRRTNAISSVNDNRIWIDPRGINPSDWSESSGTIAHETLHKLGLDDTALETKLGLTVGGSTKEISERLATDCFKNPTGGLLQ